MQFYFLLFSSVCSHFLNLIARVLFNCFARNLFNLIARGWLNCFACVFLCTFINIIFVVRIYPTIMIFFTPIPSPLRKYTGTIDGNFCSVFKMCSSLF